MDFENFVRKGMNAQKAVDERVALLDKLKPGVRIQYTDSLGKVRRGVVTVVTDKLRVYMRIDGTKGDPVWFEAHELDRLTVER